MTLIERPGALSRSFIRRVLHLHDSMIVYTPAPLRPARAGDWRADDWKCGRTEVRPVTSSPIELQPSITVEDTVPAEFWDCPF